MATTPRRAPKCTDRAIRRLNFPRLAAGGVETFALYVCLTCAQIVPATNQWRPLSANAIHGECELTIGPDEGLGAKLRMPAQRLPLNQYQRTKDGQCG